MAHFAEIKSSNNTVLRVVVVNDSDVSNNGGEYTTDSENWVANNIAQSSVIKDQNGGTYPETYWKQTSYNNNAREIYAGVGMTYNSDTDKFIPIQPFPSWTFNTDEHLWYPPIPFCENTDEGATFWDEDNQRWKNGENTKYWNGSTWQNV
jgi:hypothetical protein